MGTQGHESEVWADILAMGGEDIGHGIRIMFTSRDNQPHAGLLLYHQHRDGSVCGGTVTFSMPYGSPARKKTETTSALWEVKSIDPLTLSPSIQDKTCSENLHGHILSGRWVPC